MASVFLRFESYDFESDEKFQEGLKILHNNNNNTEKRQDMKLFFYNRFVEPIDRDGYKQWRTETEQRTCPSAPDSDPSQNQNQNSETSTETEAARQLSFSEVMRLIQEGKEVPGAETPEVLPSNQSPTPAVMGRRLKPWESSSSSK